MYELRREQMKMQQESLEAKLRTGLKERQFFYPATFETLEAILRNNFTSVPNLEVVEGEDHHSRSQMSRVQEVKFYADSDLANEAFEGGNFSSLDWFSVANFGYFLAKYKLWSQFWKVVFFCPA